MSRSSRTARMVPNLRLSAALACLAVLAACDAQVSPQYVGQPLLTMTGSVELTHDATEGTLQPALAFLDQSSAEIRIVDVESEGEFPAQFTLRVYEPPPDGALHPLGNTSAAPEAAIAFVTAVTAEHPDAIEFAQNAEMSVTPTLCNGGPCACPPEGCQRSQTQLCTHDGDVCYTETVTCPESNSPDADCTTTYSGDASLNDSPWKSFAGLSDNYMLAYLSAALPEGAPGALALGTKDALAQGYNLLSIAPLTDEDLAVQAHCEEQAATLALARFNQEHGTSYDDLQIMGLGCGPGASGCPEPASEEEVDTYYALRDEVKGEQGCLSTQFKTAKVADPANEPISVRIGSTLDPLSQGTSSVQLGSPLDPAASGTPSSP